MSPVEIGGIAMEFVVSAALVIGTFFLHFVVLRSFAFRINREVQYFKRPLLVVIFALFAIHLVEVMLYALGFYFLELIGNGSLDALDAAQQIPFSDYFYFSIACYTTLGIGDIVPHGGSRFMAGIEGLNGLVLITWSASYTYLMMEKLWSDQLDASN